MRMTLRLFLLAAGLAAPRLAQVAQAGEGVPSDVSVLAYGAAHPDCHEWTDSCRICLRNPDGRVGCSTPAIACVQKDIVCRKEKSDK